MPTSKTAWKKARNHDITLPSGAEITFAIPDLPALVESGDLPNSLIDVAVKVASGDDQEITPQLLKEQAAFYNHLIKLAVVDPKLDEADVKDIPYEDKELIVQLSTRQRDLDALGHHIGGLHNVEDFRTFRGL